MNECQGHTKVKVNVQISAMSFKQSNNDAKFITHGFYYGGNGIIMRKCPNIVCLVSDLPLGHLFTLVKGQGARRVCLHDIGSSSSNGQGPYCKGHV